MQIIYAPGFIRAYNKLSADIKRKAEIKEDLFKKDPFHPKLKTHKLSGKLKDRWSFSVDNSFRIIFRFVRRNLVYFLLIGDHEVYR
jgi:mRNA-degrading endonuclease YafQ of YafQ-DinJ toxin-antitoxin module